MKPDFSVVKESRNLLAFSAGIDSTALFFLLCEQNIAFDLAIVNYNTREQSKEELEYAKELAQKYNKKVFIKEVKLENLSNFEKQARDIRYTFFKEIIESQEYEVLITAHQLNDQLEWFMMQLSKGAGLVELVGFKKYQTTKDYYIYKPLLEYSKEELENYLKEKELKYFVDESNYDEKYKRNYFRHQFTDQLINQFKDGIKNSFNYLNEDIKSLKINDTALIKIEDFELYKNSQDDNINLRIIDKALKQKGVLLSKATKDEVLKQKELVVSHYMAISITSEYIWIAPNSSCIMDKKFKELCRIKKVPKNIRAYLFEKEIDIKNLVF